MARRGTVRFVYLIEMFGYHKIGSTGDVSARLWDLDVGPVVISLVHTIESADACGVEAILHRIFATKRVRGEWFSLNKEDVEEIKAIGRCESVEDVPAAMRSRIDWRIPGKGESTGIAGLLVRPTQEQLALIERAAEHVGKTTAVFMREAALAAARERIEAGRNRRSSPADPD